MTSRRASAALVLVAALAGAGLAAVSTETAVATPVTARAKAPDTVVVGDLTLRPCKVSKRALCGTIRRDWDPLDPSAGKVRVGFAFLPARDDSRPAVGTVVPREGGPGYSTTGSVGGYAQMYGALLDRRNMLLVDQRGTGRSEPIDCPDLQNQTGAYKHDAGRCGRSLGELADDYSTARSADDLAAVVDALDLGPVDVYGDSYGTFFAQVYVGRHPDQVRSVLLDGAYPTYGESGWYPTQSGAMRNAFTVACERSRPCRKAGAGFLPTMRRVLDRVRDRSWVGDSHDADGRPMRVRVNGKNLVTLAFGATYAPAFYRELTAALRSALRGDRVPLLRLVAEATGGDTDAGSPRAYSEGLDAAVTCHDYPMVYDMTAPPGRIREQQYVDALGIRAAERPGTYAPFTVHEYAASDWQALDWCTRWPTAPDDNPAGPPRPPGGSYPDLPVLVLSGELDSITTAAEGDIVTEQFPQARHAVVRNSFHVTAIGDTDRCAVHIARAFVRRPATEPTSARRSCAREVEPVRTIGRFPRRLADVPTASTRAGIGPRARRIGPAAAATVADLMDRWWNNYSGEGVGLRGGTWTYAGGKPVRFALDGVRYVDDLEVSGTARWDRWGERCEVDLTVRSGAARGELHGRWDTRAEGASAVLTGTFAGRPVTWRFRAP